MIWIIQRNALLSDAATELAAGTGHTDVKKKKSKRPFIVFICLVGTLTLTSALLLALSSPPLSPDAVTSLFAVNAPQSVDAIFDTKVPTVVGRWQYIYIHHSDTPSGNAATVATNEGGPCDHFVIGNGDGCVDGEIQITRQWNQQLSITHPPGGVTHIDPACITICLVGDFDRTRPTPTQTRRLAELLATLQNRLHIPASHVLTVEQPSSSAGIGRWFPLASLRSQILQ